MRDDLRVHHSGYVAPGIGREDYATDEEWATAKVELAVNCFLTSDESRELGAAGLSQAEFAQKWSQALVRHIESGVKVDLANAMLVPGLREVNDELEQKFDKIVVLHHESSTKKLTRVSLEASPPL